MQATQTEQTKFTLPTNPDAYTDKYFLRARQILAAKGLDPWVRAQVMIRKGPGNVFGIGEAVAILEQYGQVSANGGTIKALPEGAPYAPRETLMLVEARISDIIALETMYLGVMSAETTLANDRHGVDLAEVEDRLAQIVQAAGGRHVSYFGARHWRFDEDAAIAAAAFRGGAQTCSTDIGAATVGKKGIGTIPHVVENVYAYYVGMDNAVRQAVAAFDEVIDKAVPRILLCDYRNKEIDDSLASARALGGRLNACRVDTCGENVGQGAAATFAEALGQGLPVERVPQQEQKYWFGTGVTVSGVYALRKALDREDFGYVNLALSSGFASPAKVRAFVRAEQMLDSKLFEMLGVGQVFSSRGAKMDIVAVGEDPAHMRPIAKTGRGYRPNDRLEYRTGGM